MKKYKVTYIEGDTINKTDTIEAENKEKAYAYFQLEHPWISDITNVVEVTE